MNPYRLEKFSELSVYCGFSVDCHVNHFDKAGPSRKHCCGRYYFRFPPKKQNRASSKLLPEQGSCA